VRSCGRDRGDRAVVAIVTVVAIVKVVAIVTVVAMVTAAIVTAVAIVKVVAIGGRSVPRSGSSQVNFEAS
jgi:predicted flavoprotein YhiN